MERVLAETTTRLSRKLPKDVPLPTTTSISSQYSSTSSNTIMTGSGLLMEGFGNVKKRKGSAIEKAFNLAT